jgi:hypothetical protein
MQQAVPERLGEAGALSWWESTTRRVAPYWYNIFLLGLIPLALGLDTRVTGIGEQNWLGVGAWIILFACTRFSPPTERRQVWTMVGISTCVELWSSVVWGIYRYHFHNMPMFVPPGHGLVYLFALRAARTPAVSRHGPMVSRLALVAATAWMLFGLSVEPLVFHRLDVTGALFWPLFVWFMRKPSAPIYACAFFITSYLELWGTHLGTWTWQVIAPMSHIPSGNPPSVISAGYCVMDFMSIWLAAKLGTHPVLPRLVARVRMRIGSAGRTEAVPID